MATRSVGLRIVSFSTEKRITKSYFGLLNEGAMKDLAPSVIRQRLLIEATYKKNVARSDVEEHLRKLPEILNLRIYTEPVVYSPGGKGKEIKVMMASLRL